MRLRYVSPVKNVGIIGASGFTGAELLRLCASHPELEVTFATGDSKAGSPVSDLYPSLSAAYPDTMFEVWDPSLLAGVEGVFLGLPHGKSQAIMGDLLDAGVCVVDLGADFRLPDPAVYETWYKEPHTRPDLLDKFAYGLPELNRDVIVGKSAVANPGCYPTAGSLALAPFARAGLIESTRIVVNAMSGVSGAGRAPKDNTTFCAVDENVTAYGLLDHRHTSELELNLDAEVLFTPHLVPMNRGILATCCATPTTEALDEGLSTESLLGEMEGFYADEPFVVVSEAPPSTKATLGSNCVHLTARYDDRTRTVLAIGALDNLCKGASGAAVQNMNLLLGLPEPTGLPISGLYP